MAVSFNYPTAVRRSYFTAITILKSIRFSCSISYRHAELSCFMTSHIGRMYLFLGCILSDDCLYLLQKNGSPGQSPTKEKLPVLS